MAREVGTEGKPGGQAQVKRVAGTWKDLTESLNLMAGNLTKRSREEAGDIRGLSILFVEDEPDGRG